MAAKKTLNLDDLEKLGARRLAELLVDIADGNAAATRRLRLELAAEKTPRRLAAEVRKRLAQLGRGRSFLDAPRLRDLLAELEAERRTIVDRVAKIDPWEALDLMWRFMDLAGAVHHRGADRSGRVEDLFRSAGADLRPLAEAAKADPEALADRVFEALNANAYGQYDGLVGTLAPALGTVGLAHLKARFLELSAAAAEKPPQEKRVVVGYGLSGPLYRDEIDASSRRSAIRRALMDIADAQGDVDAFIAQYDEKTRKVPGIAAEIAERLLAAGRAGEALRTLDACERGPRSPFDYEWEEARINALDALGRSDDAQAARWSCFERGLSPDHLRAHLERLPDFDDVEAERRALDQVERHKNLLAALAFLVTWPDLERAARLVLRRAGELDGEHYDLLASAAEVLAGRQPLAATVLLRSMIDFALEKARYGRYRYAARHLMDCSGLAAAITDWGAVEPHAAYVARLKARHGSKSTFWAEVS